MSAPSALSALSAEVAELVGDAEILAIAEEVWSSLVDEDDVLVPVAEPQPADAISAWVEVHGRWHGAVVVTCSPATAVDLTRALLRAEPDEVFTADDVTDALGEIANVLGGNIKSMLLEDSTLGLPQSGAAKDAPDGGTLSASDVLWRGVPISVSLRRAGSPCPTAPPHPSTHSPNEVSP